MENVKPWQIVLILVAFAALGFSLIKFGFKSSPESQMANSMTLVDVQTGQRYIADLSGNNSILLPARNPETNAIALIPVYEEDGVWYLWERYRSAMDQIDVPTDAVPNVNGPVNILDSEPIRLK